MLKRFWPWAKYVSDSKIQCALTAISKLAVQQFVHSGIRCSVTRIVCVQELKRELLSTKARSRIKNGWRCLKMHKECPGGCKNNEWIKSMSSRNTMCPPGYHHTGCVATRKLGHTMYGYTLVVCRNERVLKFHQEWWSQSKWLKMAQDRQRVFKMFQE